MAEYVSSPPRCSLTFLRPELVKITDARSELLASIHRNYGDDDILIAGILQPLSVTNRFEVEDIRRFYLETLRNNTGYYDKSDAVMAAHLTIGRMRSPVPHSDLKVSNFQTLIAGGIHSGQRSLDNQITAILLKGFLQRKQFTPYFKVLGTFKKFQRFLIENGYNGQFSRKIPTMENSIVAAHLTNAVLLSGKSPEQVFIDFMFFSDKSAPESFQIWAHQVAAILVGAYAQTSMTPESFLTLYQDVRRGVTQDRTHVDDIQAAYLIYSVLGL